MVSQDQQDSPIIRQNSSSNFVTDNPAKKFPSNITYVAISNLTDSKIQAWDRYVEEHPQGTFFHLSGWKRVMEEGLNHKTHFLVAEVNQRVVGVYPLAEVKSILFGHHLVSLPFCVYGGPIADDRDVAAALEHRARELALNLNVDTFEVRYRQPPEQTNEANSPVYQSNLYYTFRKQIELGAIPPKRASEIRKAYSYGLNVKFNDDIESFLPAFDTLMRNHGTPAFPRKYFHVLREVFGNNCEIMTIREKNGRVICAGMSFYFRNEVLPYYGGGPKEGRARHATALMDFELMKHASEVRGAEIFDFGRSKKVDPKTGPFFYKCHWGFNPQPLAYEYHLINATKLPEINPTNPKFSALIAAWKRLPLWLARGIGPHISPFVG